MCIVKTLNVFYLESTGLFRGHRGNTNETIFSLTSEVKEILHLYIDQNNYFEATFRMKKE